MTRPEGKLFVQLDADFFQGARVSGLSDGAQLLYIRGLTLAKRMYAEGDISHAQIKHLRLDDFDTELAIKELVEIRPLAGH